MFHPYVPHQRPRATGPCVSSGNSRQRKPRLRIGRISQRWHGWRKHSEKIWGSRLFQFHIETRITKRGRLFASYQCKYERIICAISVFLTHFRSEACASVLVSLATLRPRVERYWLQSLAPSSFRIVSPTSVLSDLPVFLRKDFLHS